MSCTVYMSAYCTVHCNNTILTLNTIHLLIILYQYNTNTTLAVSYCHYTHSLVTVQCAGGEADGHCPAQRPTKHNDA